MTAPVQAAPRDASWHPTHGRGGRWHIVADVSALATSSGIGIDGPAAACDPHRIMLIDDMLGPAERVDPILRCRRRACQARWPT